MTIPTLHIADTTMRAEDGAVTLWRVNGMPDLWFPTKTAAEVCARARFPDEDPGSRYARIFYKQFVPFDMLADASEQATMTERQRLIGDITQAICEDNENGVAWLNDLASAEFKSRYPNLMKTIKENA